MTSSTLLKLWLRVICVCVLMVGQTAKGQSAAVAPVQSGIVIYPQNVANPRVPTLPMQSNGASGQCLDAHATFTYQLAPLVSFDKAGTAAFSLRDNPGRLVKTPLELHDGKTSLSVVIAPASQDRKVGLTLSVDHRVIASAYATALPAAQWVPYVLHWTATQAMLQCNGQTVATLKLSAPLNPQQFSVSAYHVDELVITGQGSIKLDWESGYAAKGESNQAIDSVVARLHGFDAMVISQDASSRRDCPVIQVSNASSDERKISLQFALSSEVRNHRDEWSQSISIPARSTVEAPLTFPSKLDTDVYHLAVKADGVQLAECDTLRNFMFVNRREEPAGPAKFGFHTFGVTVLGSWPDALPAHWRHMYANWGYIVGPMWVNDWDGKPGLNPDTPAEQWNWEQRIDLAIAEGRKVLVSISSVPYFPWMRDKEYDASYMNKTYPWGIAGGRPNFTRYRQFIHALAQHYKGRVDAYELDNEPNTISYSGKPAADYALVMKAAGQEIHAADPHAKVFGISGTSTFVDFMRDAFSPTGSADSAANFIDGVTWHTYTTPMLPKDAGLSQMLQRAKEVIASTGRNLPMINSETGVYTAPRETFDQPISPARLAELIKQGIQPVHVPTGWPSYALDEWTAGKSMVQNITCNFAAGVNSFFFFGWDPVVEKGKTWFGNPEDFDCFSIFSRVKDGTMTPSLYTLACAVAMTQMEGILPEKTIPINQDGIIGAIFEKAAGGGQLAVLWSNGGRRTTMLQTTCAEVECVSLLGVEKKLVSKSAASTFLHRIELDDKPIYLHVRKPGMTLSASPVIGVERTTGKLGETKIKFTLVNRFDKKWSGMMDLSNSQGMTLTPAKIAYSLNPGERATIQTTCTPLPGTSRGIHLLEAATKFADGTPFVFPLEIDIRPNFSIARLPNEFSIKEMATWKPQVAEQLIDKPQQVAIGRPPELSSLQEERYWKGPDELSAKVATGYNDKGFFARITVRDKNMGPLKRWPGVEGSCIEWFFDFRSAAQGLGSASYEKGVAQIISKPALDSNMKIETWYATVPAPFTGVESVGGVIDKATYWVGIFIPWNSVDPTAKMPDAIGFDVGVDAPPAGAAGRKSQMFLFGGAYNNKDASGFGIGSCK